MNPLTKAMSSASSGMDAQAYRLRVVSENISNADTHGYQRKLLTFQSIFDHNTGAERVSVSHLGLDQSLGEQEFNPSHPLADQDGFVTLSNVEMMTEIADAKEAGRSYEANLATFKQAKEMYQGLIDLLRR